MTMAWRPPKEEICKHCAWFIPSEDPEDMGVCERATESEYAAMVLATDDREARLLVSPLHTCGEYVELDDE